MRSLVSLVSSLSLAAGLVLAPGCDGHSSMHAMAATPTAPAAAAPAAPAAPGSAAAPSQPTVQLRVTDAGFEPSRLTIPAGKPVNLVVTRTTDQTCAKAIVFPSANIRADLPLNQPVTIHIPAQAGGELAFQCGMGMLKGALVVAR